MSTRYQTEPVTSGKLVLSTTFGALDVELWPKEAPLACRNFVQLCLEGYYNNSPFHRVIPKFMAQTGGRVGSGEDMSIYGPTFKDEFHSRIRFNHPGQLAMASDPEQRDSNCTQFFVTLGACEWLNGKHTIFGKVTGDTIFNALKFNQVETDSNDRPLELARILSVKVLANPFPDIVPRKLLAPADIERQRVEQEEQEKKRRVAKKNFNLMSFGDEAEEEEKQADAQTEGFGLAVNTFKVKSKERSTKQAPREVVAGRAEKETKAVAAEDKGSQKEGKKKRKKEKEGKKKKRKKDKEKEKEKSKKNKKAKKENALEEYKRMLKKAKEVSTKRGRSSKELSIETEADERLMSEYERRRYKYVKLNRANRHKQDDTLKMLENFKRKLNQTKANASQKQAYTVEQPQPQKSGTSVATEEYKGGIGENPIEGNEADDDEDDDGWMTAKLSFKRHIDDDYKKNIFEMKADDYAVYDPKLQKKRKNK